MMDNLIILAVFILFEVWRVIECKNHPYNSLDPIGKVERWVMFILTMFWVFILGFLFLGGLLNGNG